MKIDASARDALKVTNMPNDRLCSILTLGSAAGLGRSADDESSNVLLGVVVLRFPGKAIRRRRLKSGKSLPTMTTVTAGRPLFRVSEG